MFERRIQRALALNRRGEVRSDGLLLSRAYTHLKLEWRARPIHPWDRMASVEKQRALFVKQCFADAGAALSRLFEQLPEVDSIDVCIREPRSNAVIMAGVVSRSTLQAARPLSDRMWIGQLGLRFHLNGDRFEPLEDEPWCPQTVSANQ